MTTAEIATLTAERQRIGKEWAGPDLIAAELGKPGLGGETVILDGPHNVDTAVLLAMMSDASVVNFYGFLDGASTTEQLAFKRRFYAANQGLDVTHPLVRGGLDNLALAGLITSQEAAGLKGLGERPKTRSEELFNRQLTINEITEGIANAV